MSNLLSWNFWFNLRPGALTLLPQKIFLIFVIALIFFTALFSYIKAVKNKGLYVKLWGKLYFFSLVNSIIGLLMMFFNYEMAPFLTMRFWYLLWFIGSVVWLFYIIKEIMKIPEKKQQLKKEKEFKKYIP
ncbi:MAG: hypothetical protein AAB653_01880 [Patescibacteria group bacterium]